jgi:hypothetical protein
MCTHEEKTGAQEWWQRALAVHWAPMRSDGASEPIGAALL